MYIFTEKSSVEANKNLAVLTKEDIANLSDRLGAEWKKLATELSFPEDDIDYFAGETDDTKKQATKMLTVWMVSSLKRLCVTLDRATKEM